MCTGAGLEIVLTANNQLKIDFEGMKNERLEKRIRLLENGWRY